LVDGAVRDLTDCSRYCEMLRWAVHIPATRTFTVGARSSSAKPFADSARVLDRLPTSTFETAHSTTRSLTGGKYRTL
jgi:hypothetical protein